MKQHGHGKLFLCLVYFELEHLMALSKKERAELDRESLAYDATLEDAGHFVAAQALQPPSYARTVSVRRGKTTISDGPFAETKEQLGGFILIRTGDIRKATTLAAGIPLAKLGRIEVRPIHEVPVR